MRALLVALLLLGSIPAQRTWVVDPLGSGDFLDLPPAVQAASVGDTILLRGHYTTATTVDKGLRIVADVRGSGVFGPMGHMIVRDIPVGQEVVLAGFVSAFLFEPQNALTIQDCAGKVHVGAWYASPTGDPIQTRSFVRVRNCGHVTFRGNRLIDVEVEDSTVLFTHSILAGDAWPRGTLPTQTGLPGLVSKNSDVTLALCIVEGARSYGGPAIIPGIHMTGGRLRITGDSTVPFSEGYRRVDGGFSFNRFTGQGTGGPAIHSDGGLVEVDPRILLRTYQGLPPIVTGTSEYRTRTIPLLTSSQPRMGLEDVIARVHGPSGAQAWVFLSLPHDPVSIPGVGGDIWLDPATLLPFGQGTIGTNGMLEVRHPLPRGILPRGHTLAFQGLLLDQGAFGLTTPTMPIVLDYPPR